MIRGGNGVAVMAQHKGLEGACVGCLTDGLD